MSLGWPYLLLVLGLILVSAFRAPVAVDRKRQEADQLKTEKIGELERHRDFLEENAKAMGTERDRAELARQECEMRLAAHPSTKQESRQIALVRSKLHDVTPDERHVLLFILDHGKISRYILDCQLSAYPANIRHGAIGKGMSTGLLMEELIPGSPDKFLYVAPALEPALKIVLSETS